MRDSNRHNKKKDYDGPGLFDDLEHQEILESPSHSKSDVNAHEVNPLSDKVVQLEKEVASLQAENDNKDNTIAGLQSKLAKKTQENNDLQHNYRLLVSMYNDKHINNGFLNDKLSRIQSIMDEKNETDNVSDTSNFFEEEESKSCIYFTHSFTKEKLLAIVKDCYDESPKNLAIIEITLFYHSLLKKRNEHKAFVKELVNLGFIKINSEKDVNMIINALTNKYNRLPKGGYKSWGKKYENDKNICWRIAKILGPNQPYNF